ncbi:bcl-2-modifying factor-like [Mobula hypostoma]|uniref:bcl-2-modifying factor-like n=1 Tax=Mobula hypostoma TaxID=723540 RepID=UPI002FC352F0
MDLCEAEDLDTDDEVFDHDLMAPDSGYSEARGNCPPSWNPARPRLFSQAQSYGSPYSHREQCDRGTQTSSSTPSALHPELPNPMLPSGVGSEPQRLFYGNAGHRLQFSEVFEVPRASRASLGDQADDIPLDLLPVDRVEVRIGQKLRQIGDQFHSSYVERRNRNENRADQPFWWRLLVLIFALIFDPDENVEAAGQRRG